MNGFVGVLASEPGRVVDEADIDAFAMAYRELRGGNGEMAHANRRVRAFVVANSDASSPAIHRRGDSWAMSAGAPRHACSSLLDADLKDIEGQFAILLYSAETQTATVASDPFGMFGLFIAERDGLTYVSTSALVLACHLSSAPSRVGLHTFLLAGYQCGTRTSWDGVDRVQAGVRLDFTSTERKRTTYWRPVVDRAIQRLSIAGSVEHCLETAIEAVRMVAGARGTVWCDLTGGYDTRILALLARTAGIPFITSTNGEGGGEDARLARQIAATAGWEWSLISPPERWEQILPDRMTEAIGWGDVALEAGQLAGVLWGHQLKAERAPVVLNGGGGEHYWSYAWQHEYGRSGRSGRTDLDMWVRTRMLRSASTRVFAGDPRPSVISDLRARVEPVIEPYLDEPRAVQADALYMHKGTGHFGAYASAAASHLDVLLPFYTRESFTAAFSTNPRYRFGHRFYRRLIDRLDPSIAAIPTAKGGPAQPPRLGNLAAFAPYYGRLGEKGLNKASQRLLGRSIRRPPDIDDDAAARVRAAALTCVGTDVDIWHSRALYEREQLRGMLAAAVRRDFRESVLLDRILTVELGLRAAGVGVE